MRRRHRICAALTAIAAGAMVIGGTAMAAWSVAGRAVNILTTPSFSNRILEEYQIPSHVNPGQKVDKVVHVKNEGNVDSFIRVKVDKAFGTRDGQGVFQKDESLDPEMIQVEYSSLGWVQREDGYWYYTDVLKAGETTKEPLLKSYRLSEKADNLYKNRDGEVLVTMESIQAGTNALEELWGIRGEELGIESGACRNCDTVTRVTLQKNRNLLIDAADADLFANFKNLLPGCSRTQTIAVSNQYSEEVELFLRAEETDQGSLSAGQKELVEKLLAEYAFIELREGSQVLYQGPVNGSGSGSGNTMKKDISLGVFSAGKSRNLTVTLTVSPEMDNTYQKLTGKVNWIFTAAGEGTSDSDDSTNNRNEGDSNDGADSGADSGAGSGSDSGVGSSGTAVSYGTEGKIGPKTGDPTDIAGSLLMLAAAAALIACGSRILRKRTDSGRI